MHFIGQYQSIDKSTANPLCLWVPSVHNNPFQDILLDKASANNVPDPAIASHGAELLNTSSSFPSIYYIKYVLFDATNVESLPDYN